ncbi:MAG: WD40 repeat domain-containing protein [Planctomycetes bacterium]|nr:WD40 repeat domain-containing protein [Planctomycetota bacterium]
MNTIVLCVAARYRHFGAWIILAVVSCFPQLAFSAEIPAPIHQLPEGADLVEFHPKAPLVAFRDQKGFVRIWSTESWSEKRVLEESRVTQSLRFSPEGRWLAVRSAKKVQVWKTTDWTLATSIDVEALGLAAATTAPSFTPDAASMVVAVSDGEEAADALVYRTEDWTLSERLISRQKTTSPAGTLWCFDMDPKGTWIIAGRPKLHFWKRREKGWELVGTEAREAVPQRFRRAMTRFDPTGEWVATVSAIGSVRIRRRKDMRPIATWPTADKRGIYDLEFTRDGAKFLTCAEDLRLFETKTGKTLGTLEVPASARPLDGLSLSPDGTLLVVVGKDRPRVYTMSSIEMACR